MKQQKQWIPQQKQWIMQQKKWMARQKLPILQQNFILGGLMLNVVLVFLMLMGILRNAILFLRKDGIAAPQVDGVEALQITATATNASTMPLVARVMMAIAVHLKLRVLKMKVTVIGMQIVRGILSVEWTIVELNQELIGMIPTIAVKNSQKKCQDVL
jgi:hypothetical protein